MFEVYSRAQINFDTDGPGKLDYLYNPQTVFELIKPHKVLHFYYGEAERYEGFRHNGLVKLSKLLSKKKKLEEKLFSSSFF